MLAIEFIFDENWTIASFPAIRRSVSQSGLWYTPPLNGITSLSLQAAQAEEWYNKVLGAVHFVGDKVESLYAGNSVAW